MKRRRCRWKKKKRNVNIRKCVVVVVEEWTTVEKMKKRRFGEVDPLDRNARKEYREYWI